MAGRGVDRRQNREIGRLEGAGVQHAQMELQRLDRLVNGRYGPLLQARRPVVKRPQTGIFGNHDVVRRGDERRSIVDRVDGDRDRVADLGQGLVRCGHDQHDPAVLIRQVVQGQQGTRQLSRDRQRSGQRHRRIIAGIGRRQALRDHATGDRSRDQGAGSRVRIDRVDQLLGRGRIQGVGVDVHGDLAAADAHRRPAVVPMIALGHDQLDGISGRSRLVGFQPHVDRPLRPQVGDGRREALQGHGVSQGIAVAVGDVVIREPLRQVETVVGRVLQHRVVGQGRHQHRRRVGHDPDPVILDFAAHAQAVGRQAAALAQPEPRERVERNGRVVDVRGRRNRQSILAGEHRLVGKHLLGPAVETAVVVPVHPRV